MEDTTRTAPEGADRRRPGAPVRHPSRVPLAYSVIVLGTAALVVQVLLLRELMTAWRGNEMSFGIALTVWLTAGGAGSVAYGFVVRNRRATSVTVSSTLATLGVLAPLSLFAARALRDLLGLSSGEITGITPLLLASLLSLAPFTLVSGFAFAAATAVVDRQRGAPGAAAGAVYLLEAAGAALGGVAASFVLLPLLNPVATALLVSSLCFGCAGLLTRRTRSALPGVISAAVVAVVALTALAERADDASVAAQWRELGFVSQANSVYGRIVAVSSGSQKSLYESGVLAASVPDRLAAEESVHLPMLVHPSPERVLLLGGGLGGAVAEVLKHPGVASVDYVELDPEVIREARLAFGDAMTIGFDDPRVSVHFADARFFVKRAAGRCSYDVVVLAAPEPTTARLNRLYTSEFMAEVDAVLAPEGVLGFAVRSSENYVGAELAEFLASLRATARSVFPEVALYPGDPCHFLATRSGQRPTRDPSELSERVDSRGLDVVYVRDYYLHDRLSEERVGYLDSVLAGVEGAKNTDLFPVAYYLSMVLWNRQFSGVPGLLPAARRVVSATSAAVLSLALLLALSLPALRRRGNQGPARRAVYASVIIVGATEISLELTALLAFQSIYGYVYHQMALIVAAFMAGLALGGGLGVAAAARGARAWTFILLQLLIAVVPVALGAVLSGVAVLPADALDTAAALFPMLVVASALLAGAQFPVAARLLADDRGDAGAVGGRIYGSDLLGAAIGATVTSVFLLPILGVTGTMRALSVLNAAVLVALVLTLLPVRRAAPR